MFPVSRPSSRASSLEAAGFACPAWRTCPLVLPTQPHWKMRTRTNQGMGGSRKRGHGVLDGLPDQQKALLRSHGGPLASVPFISRATMSRAWSRRFSDCCSFGVSVCLSPSLFALAGVAVFSTALATTGRGVRWRGCWAVEGSHWKTQPPAFAVRDVRTNVFVRDLDLAMFDNMDERRLEVVVDGLPLFRGAQLAVDTTLVCPLTRESRARPRCATKNGAALEQEGFPRAGCRRIESPTRRSCWRSGLSVFPRDSPFPEESCFSQSTGFAGDPSREGPRRIGAQVEFDVGVYGARSFALSLSGQGPCWRRWTHAYCARGDAGPPPRAVGAGGSQEAVSRKMCVMWRREKENKIRSVFPNLGSSKIVDCPYCFCQSRLCSDLRSKIETVFIELV